MQRFVGRYERQVDDKGRLALPSAFRPRFEPRCFLARGQDGCIDVMTEGGFDDMVTELLEKVKVFEAELSKELDVDVATIAAPLDSRSATVRGGEAAIGNLIADAAAQGPAFQLEVELALSLNGAGVRVKLIVDVYAAGLYVPQRAADPAVLLDQAGPRCQ
mgnify:CR=1 FL=1